MKREPGPVQWPDDLSAGQIAEIKAPLLEQIEQQERLLAILRRNYDKRWQQVIDLEAKLAAAKDEALEEAANRATCYVNGIYIADAIRALKAKR